MSSQPATTQPQPPPPGRRKRELLGPTALIVMVVAILAFTAVAIAMELASNRGKAFKATVAIVGPVAGSPNQFQLLFRVTNTGNRPGRPDKCEAVLFNLSGDRVGVGAVSLKDTIPLYGSGFLTEGSVLAQQGDAALGVQTTLHYSDQLDNPANKAFVAAWKKEYGESSTPVRT